MSKIICTICLEEMGTNNSSMSIICGHIYHEICLIRWKKKSTQCPDCRAYITGGRKVFLNATNYNGDADEPISDVALAATINGLTEKISQYELEISRLEEDHFNYQTTIFVLSLQNDQKKHQLKQLEKRSYERNRRMTSLNKELKELEAKLKNEEIKNYKLIAKLTEMEKLQNKIKTNKMQLILHEKNELNAKLKRLENGIDLLGVRKPLDNVENRRITRSQTRQMRK